jgi:NADH dehydrogenase
MTVTRKTQIVIVGGGAGGLELARRLGARFGRHTMTSSWSTGTARTSGSRCLHEVAAGSLDANLDEVGYRSHCHRWGYRFFLGNAGEHRSRGP